MKLALTETNVKTKHVYLFWCKSKKKNRIESERYKSTYLSVPFQVICVGSFTQLQLSVEWWLIHEETTFHRISEKKN